MNYFFISGFWTDTHGVVTDYAVHEARLNNGGGYSFWEAKKTSKANTFSLVSNELNNVKTLVWNYSGTGWIPGSEIHVVNDTPKYLRTNHDGSVRDNLLHLINYNGIF
ncbi:hypothetical protein [Flavobacterium sp. 3HN19-14]|uniref:hypothetical protein n=1 Tax=Flavobacterium sp. 3HN19-14 TaxID=3448133 RepID=UPI003EE21AC6